jgi:hypothetical protein
MLDPIFSPEEQERLAGFAELEPTHAGDSALVVAAQRAIQERTQAEAVARLGRLGLPRATLPWLNERAATPDAVACLADCLSDG